MLKSFSPVHVMMDDYNFEVYMMVHIHVIFWVVEVWVHIRGSSYGICGWKSGKFFAKNFSFYPRG
jgi:hypothetical protein